MSGALVLSGAGRWSRSRRRVDGGGTVVARCDCDGVRIEAPGRRLRWGVRCATRPTRIQYVCGGVSLVSIEEVPSASPNHNECVRRYVGKFTFAWEYNDYWFWPRDERAQIVHAPASRVRTFVYIYLYVCIYYTVGNNIYAGFYIRMVYIV